MRLGANTSRGGREGWTRRAAGRGLVLGGLVAIALPALAACGGVATTANGATLAKPAAQTEAGQVVEMSDQNTFTPATLTIAKGTAVTWRNSGTMPHNVVSDAAIAIDRAHAQVPAGVKPFSSPMLMGGGTWTYTFATAGDYVYFCQPHEALGMVGRVTVTD